MTTKNYKNMSFEDLSKLIPGTIVDQGKINNIPYVILRAKFSLTAYLGIPLDHPLAKLEWDDIPLNVHGGLTYGQITQKGDHEALYYWIGWDYAHYTDFAFYDLLFPELTDEYESNRIKWTVDMVYEHVKEAAKELEELLEMYDDNEK